MSPKYQVMPPLSAEQYDALKADIATAGVRVPIEVDENGEIIDGHHRRAIAEALGVECPETVIRGLEEFEKLDRAFVLNATRRHFDREQKRAVVMKSLKLHPRLADREHARRCGVSHPTISGVRAAMEAAGQLESFTSRLGGDGRERPAHNEPTTPKSTPVDQPEPSDTAGEDEVLQRRAGGGVGQLEEDRPGSADLGEADSDEGSLSRADGSRPPAEQTGPEEVLPPKPPSGPVDGREQGRAGVSGPAPVPPRSAVVELLEELAEKYEALDVDVLGPLLTSEDLAGIDRNLNRVVAIVELLTRWHERAQL